MCFERLPHDCLNTLRKHLQVRHGQQVRPSQGAMRQSLEHSAEGSQVPLGCDSVDVEVSGDLQHVKVYVSILGDADSKALTMQALESAKGYIRSEIGRRVPLRLTPELHFVHDTSMEHGAHILRVLSEIDRDDREDHV